MLYYLLSAALVAIDQAVKYWVRATIPLEGAIPFIPGLMDLAYIQNTGAAFSMLARHTWLLALVSLVVSCVIAAALKKDVFPHWVGRLALALILAGGVGNLIDRAFMGFVTDMFKTTFINFAVFNVADICVCTGGALMVLYVIFLGEKKEEDQ